jgi:hypothetical protein
MLITNHFILALSILASTHDAEEKVDPTRRLRFLKAVGVQIDCDNLLSHLVVGGLHGFNIRGNDSKRTYKMDATVHSSDIEIGRVQTVFVPLHSNHSPDQNFESMIESVSSRPRIAVTPASIEQRNRRVESMPWNVDYWMQTILPIDGFGKPYDLNIVGPILRRTGEAMNRGEILGFAVYDSPLALELYKFVRKIATALINDAQMRTDAFAKLEERNPPLYSLSDAPEIITGLKSFAETQPEIHFTSEGFLRLETQDSLLNKWIKTGEDRWDSIAQWIASVLRVYINKDATNRGFGEGLAELRLLYEKSNFGFPALKVSDLFTVKSVFLIPDGMPLSDHEEPESDWAKEPVRYRFHILLKRR